MFPLSHSANSVVRTHLEFQFAFFNDLSRTLTDSFCLVCKANLKLSQIMLEETMTAGRSMLSSGSVLDVFAAIMTHAQPASEKLRAAEETARSERKKTEALKNFHNPFKQAHTKRGNGRERYEARPQYARADAGASLQFDSLDHNGAVPGNVQGPVAKPAQHTEKQISRNPG